MTAANNSVSQAIGAKTNYTIGLKASSTGRLAGTAGSQITITFPSGTDLSKVSAFDIEDTTTGQQVGNFCSRTAVGVNPPVATCNIFVGSTVNPGDAVTITLDQVINPSPASPPVSETLTVFTSSDTTPITSATTTNYQVVAQNPVTNVTAANNSVSQAIGAKTNYTIGLKASSTGRLAGTAGSQITITFPSGTDLSKVSAFDIEDTTTGQQVGNFCSRTAVGVNPPVATCNIFVGSTVNPGDAVTITLDQVINPSPASPPVSETLTVFTSSDTTPITSATTTNYQVVAQNPVTNVTAANNSVSQAIGAKTNYTIGLKASSTGRLAGTAGSQITITFPSGTDLSKVSAFDIEDTTTGQQVGNFCSRTAVGVNPPVATCNIFVGSTVNPGDAVTITLDQVINPSPASPPVSETLTVFTSSDTTPITSATTTNYQVVASHAVGSPSIALSNQAPSAAGVSYTVGLATSATGGLAGTAGSQITITLASGTDLTHVTSFSIIDTTTGQQVGNFCSRTAVGVNPPVATCNIFVGSTVNPGDLVNVTVNGITNPSAASANDSFIVSTTSDTSGSGNYSIGGNPPAPSVTSISPTSGPTAGGTSVTINGANFTGATVKFGSSPATITSNIGTQMVVASPPGSGAVDVTVTNAGGTSATSAADRFTYTSPPPPPPPTSPPAVTPSSPSTPSATSAAVLGAVNPHGLATTVVFQYGLDLSQRGPGSSTTLYDQSTPPQQVGSGTGNQSVSANLTNLIAGGLYHVRMVATNSAGTTNGPDQTFTTPKAAPPPPPVLGKTQNAAPVSGKTFILINGKFVPLTSATKIPSGATIDALHGSLSLTSATGAGKKTQTGTFGGAVFKVTQARSGLTTLSLVNNAFKGAPIACRVHDQARRQGRPPPCPRRRSSSCAAATTTASSAPRAATRQRPPGVRSGRWQTAATER